jgi:SAM-dependent methyltransferase
MHTHSAPDRKARSVLTRQQLRRALKPAWWVWRRTTPIGGNWGYDRGRPIDRQYIETFLSTHRTDINGRVLEIKEPLYARRFGTGVTTLDILDIDPANPHCTIVADLADARTVPDASYDCCIVTQTLQYIYDVPSAVRELHRILADNGVLLVTVPAVTHIDPRTKTKDYWRFTADSCERLFRDAFGEANVTVGSFGNVLAAIAFLHGLAREELTRTELDANDPLYPVVVTVRAVKRGRL